ncbi:hypothetical protein GCM10022200_09500 [Microbacterium awajiense]|uniref:FMN-binding domain-containing protein n=1 Tax=Microbacterium awajiense TaxID=415214 RepID=A0ABP7ACJ9_9MICO
MTPSASRPVRAGAAAVGVLGALALAGCASATGDGGDTAQDAGDSADGGSAGYVDGTYTADGTYATPESVETIVVTVTLADDIVTEVEVAGDPQKSESQQFQSQFIGGIAAEVVGKDIDEISVDRVAGSSLTSSGFNQAIDTIKAEAAA